MAWVTAVAQIRSLVQEPPYATGAAEKAIYIYTHMYIYIITSENIQKFLIELNPHLVYSPTISFLSIYPREIQTYFLKEASISIFFFFYSLTRGIWKFPVKGQVGATAAGLHHIHSNAGSESHLQPTTICHTLWQRLVLNPLIKARD